MSVMLDRPTWNLFNLFSEQCSDGIHQQVFLEALKTRDESAMIRSQMEKFQTEIFDIERDLFQ